MAAWPSALNNGQRVCHHNRLRLAYLRCNRPRELQLWEQHQERPLAIQPFQLAFELINKAPIGAISDHIPVLPGGSQFWAVVLHYP